MTFKSRYPSAITVEIMDICNLRCRHCHLQFQSSTKRGFMGYELFEKIIERISPLLRKVNRLNFASVEALFHPRIFDMIDLARKYSQTLNIYINTNGMLLDDARIDNLLKRKIYDIHLSLDGFQKEAVESFKTGVNFDKVIENLKRLRERGKGRFNIRANFVLHKKNMRELLDYIDFCHNLGMISLHVIGFIAYIPQMADYCLYSNAGIKEVDELIRKAEDKAKRLGIAFKRHGTKIKPVGCGYASDLMYIDKKGNVAACSLLARQTRVFFLGKRGLTRPVIWGNVLEKDPWKVWTSNGCVSFRSLLHKKHLPSQCSLCAIGHGVIC